MKTAITILCVFMSAPLFAQNTIFAGKITDAAGTPLKDVRIYVNGTRGHEETKSDALGLYHTQDLPEGDYTVTAVMNATSKATGRVRVAYVRGEKRYYVLRVEGNILNITTTNKNIFMEAKLDSIRKSSQNVDVPPTKQQYNTPTKNTEHFIVPRQRKLEKK